jgi:hypothetical protein
MLRGAVLGWGASVRVPLVVLLLVMVVQAVALAATIVWMRPPPPPPCPQCPKVNLCTHAPCPLPTRCPVKAPPTKVAAECFEFGTPATCREAFEAPSLDVASMMSSSVVRALRYAAAEVPITFVTVPRAFEGAVGQQQKAAIRSWTMLHGAAEVLVLGQDRGVERFARRHGMRHGPVAADETGVPLLDSVLRSASQLAGSGALCLINTDIALPPSWWAAMQAVLPTLLAQDKPFLLVGPRLMFDAGVVWDPRTTSWSDFFEVYVKTRRFRAVSDWALDWFVFRRGTLDHFPPFRIGRYVWDTYLMDAAVRLDWNTVTVFENDANTAVLPAAYGLHWEHTREHHKEKGEPEASGRNSTRLVNEGVAARHGGLGHYGRLQGASLLLRTSEDGSCVLTRRFDYGTLGARLPPREGRERPPEGLIIQAELNSSPVL